MPSLIDYILTSDAQLAKNRLMNAQASQAENSQEANAFRNLMQQQQINQSINRFNDPTYKQKQAMQWVPVEGRQAFLSDKTNANNKAIEAGNYGAQAAGASSNPQPGNMAPNYQGSTGSAYQPANSNNVGTDIANASMAGKEKSTRTTKGLDRSTAGKNAETTLSGVDSIVDDLSKYAGGEGLINKGVGALQGFLGQDPGKAQNNFNYFHNTLLPQLVNQLTSFYNTSITPEVRQHLEREFTPQMGENAEQYKFRVKSFVKVLQAELEQQKQNAAENIALPSILLDSNAPEASSPPTESAKKSSNADYIKNILAKQGQR